MDRLCSPVGCLKYWLSEITAWICVCRIDEVLGCDRCRVLDALDAATIRVLASDWMGAYEAVCQAASIERRLEPLRDDLELRAYPLEIEVSVDAERFACGLTSAEHAEIVADAIRREAELDKIGQLHDHRLGIHLALANHPGCGSTLAWPLPNRGKGAP